LYDFFRQGKIQSLFIDEYFFRMKRPIRHQNPI
jgi:hypothetical protein